MRDSDAALASTVAVASAFMSLFGTNPVTRGATSRSPRRGGGIAHAPDPAEDELAAVFDDHTPRSIDRSIGFIARTVHRLNFAPDHLRTRIARDVACKVACLEIPTHPDNDAWCAFHRERLAEISIEAPERERVVIAKSLGPTGWGRFVADTVDASLEPKRDRIATAFNDLVVDGRDVFVVAGGAPTHAAFANSSSMAVADIDLCVYGGHTLEDGYNIVEEWIRTNWDVFAGADAQDPRPLDHLREWNRVADTMNLYLPLGSKMPNIQINASSAPARSVEDVLLGFDRALCACAVNGDGTEIVALKRTVDAHRDRVERVDLVFGSGDARSAARTGLRDLKYTQRFGVQIVKPPWIEDLIAVLRDDVARELIGDLNDTDVLLRKFAGKRMRVTLSSFATRPYGDRRLWNQPWYSPDPPSRRDKSIYKALQEFSHRCMAIVSSTSPGLVTTLMMRFVLDAHLDLLTCYRPDALQAGAYDHDKTQTFVSRQFSRKCNAVKDLPCFTGPVLSDVCEWIDVTRALAREARALPDTARALVKEEKARLRY